MKNRQYRNYKSFFGKTRIVLALLAIIPYLLVVYLFAYEKIELTDMVVLFSALALFSILAGFYLVRNFSDQLVHLAIETSKLENAENSQLIQTGADQELRDISEHFNTVIQRLKEADNNVKEQSTQLLVYARDLSRSYEKIKKEEEVRSRLSRYLEKSLVDRLINSQNSALFENERKQVTVLFADIRNFTALAESMVVEDVVTMLNQFFEAMVDIVFQHNGTLDKFVGDQLMAVFGLISPEDGAPVDAIQAAIKMQGNAKKLMQERAGQDIATFEIGIGINTGSAIVGNVGSCNRMDYTVIGDCVNVAARLEEIAAGGEIIVGEPTYKRTYDRFHFDKKGSAQLKNKTEPVTYYHVVV